MNTRTECFDFATGDIELAIGTCDKCEYDLFRFHIAGAMFHLADTLFDDKTVTMYDLIEFYNELLLEAMVEFITIPQRESKDSV